LKSIASIMIVEPVILDYKLMKVWLISESLLGFSQKVVLFVFLTLFLVIFLDEIFFYHFLQILFDGLSSITFFHVLIKALFSVI
jgi:hypothetical protein